MSASAGVDSLPRLLEVLTVEVITGKGRSITISSVRCPIRGKSAAVEECADCAQGDGLARDALARGEWFCCRTRGPTRTASDAGPSVRDLMRRSAVALRSGLAASAAAQALRARGESGAPVVDGDGRPVGFVGEAQLLRAGPGSKVADAMSRVALSVPEDAPASRAAAMLASEGIERVAVVSGDGAIAGVLSALDVVSWFASAGGPLGAGGAGAPAGG